MGSEPLQNLSACNDDFGLWQGNTHGPLNKDEYERFDAFQYNAKLLTTKKVPFVCVRCYHTAIGRKSEKNNHYFQTKPCKACNATKSRHTRANKYSDMVFAYARDHGATVWALTITLGNDVEKRVGHTTVKEMRDTMMSRMNEMRERSEDWNKWFQGGFQVFEHTIKDGSYHPHLHLVCLSQKTRLPLKGSDSITLHSVLRRFGFGEYAYATKAYMRIEGKKVFSNTHRAVYNAVRYIMKYSIKDTGGARKLSRFGCMRGYTLPSPIKRETLRIIDGDDLMLVKLPAEGRKPHLPRKWW